ncbi:MAG: NAD(P)/FAD-dependent oxidoreductase [Pseudomonadota bacterium]
MSHYEAVIIGAGLTGIYQLYRLVELGIDVTCLEAADDLGGTWFHNRYPGCRFDSESYTYGYSFSRDLVNEWDWTEHFSPQPENLRYLQHVAEKFQLRRHMQFGCKVERAIYDNAKNLWTIECAGGKALTCRFLLTAIGVLSTPVMPRIDGIERFSGPSFHTYYWPHEPLDLSGKRVGVIGTGATAVQLIPEVAKAAGELYVFQRRPNWCAPLHNRPISREEMNEIRSRFDDILEQCRRTPGGFIHMPDRRKLFEVPEEERRAFFEELYRSSGFRIWQGNFRDVLMDEDANEEFSRFVAEKIRERVNDPVLAEKLIPTDHGFGTRRVPMETNYYETYNRDDVFLVDVNEQPIERITPTGVKTNATDYPLDIIVYATGFDAMTGAFDKIEFVGEGGTTLADKWADGPRTYLGVQTAGFPNLLMLTGPQSGSGFTNFGRGVEEMVDWMTGLVEHVRDHPHPRIATTIQNEDDWGEHVKDMYELLLLSKVDSWFTGYNPNVEGRDRMRLVAYNGGAPRYRKELERVAEQGFDGFVIG